MKTELERLLTKFEGNKDYKPVDYISFSILRRSKGGYSIYLVYEHLKHPLKSNTLIITTVDMIIRIVKILEEGLMDKAGIVSDEDMNNLLDGVVDF